jgi:hypothetical protein
MPARTFAPLALLILTLLSGCGSARMGRVKGRVTFNGKPVSQAMLTFSPAAGESVKEPGKPATGISDEEGNYDLSTFRNHDGALVGKHNVTVTLDDTNPARCARFQELTLDVAPGDNKLDIDLKK